MEHKQTNKPNKQHIGNTKPTKQTNTSKWKTGNANKHQQTTKNYYPLENKQKPNNRTTKRKQIKSMRTHTHTNKEQTEAIENYKNITVKQTKINT